MKPIFTLSFIFIITSFSFSQKTSSKILFYDDIKQTQNSFLDAIPIGTTLDDAKAILKKNKLKYELYLKQDFTDGDKTLKDIDFLYVDKRKSKGWVSKRWQVAIAYENDKVTGIYVSYGLIGM